MIIFNGKRWAEREYHILKNKVNSLKQDYGIKPHLVTILVGDNKDNKLYTNLKMKTAKKIGADFTAKVFEENISSDEIINFINQTAESNKVHGIMIQMPLPQSLKKDRDKIINSIPDHLDVDGLKLKSDFYHPTAKAIYQILTEALILNDQDQILLIGNKGMVGSSLSRLLKDENIDFVGIDIDSDLNKHTTKADIIISTTGKPGLITGSMIKQNAKIIDVGYPKADVDQKSVSAKAKFITPVPGGVGPVTISILLQNLISSAEKIATSHKE